MSEILKQNGEGADFSILSQMKDQFNSNHPTDETAHSSESSLSKSETIDKPLLKPEFLDLLKKEEPSEEEKLRIYELSVNHYVNNYTRLKNNVHIEHLDDPDKPISQVGFSIDFDHNNEFSHEIFANQHYLRNYPVERIILVACHEAAHLERNDAIAKTIDFSTRKGIEQYHTATRRNTDTNWYEQEEEKRADTRGYFAAKNIFQRAVHDTQDSNLKRKFWDSYSLLEYNEKLEMEKHESRHD